MKLMTIQGYQAVISFDPDIGMFRGEFVGLNGGADFYAKEIDALHQEGEVSLNIFLEACADDGVNPRKSLSDELSLHLDPSLREAAVMAAAAQGQSVDQWAVEAIWKAVLTAP
ncbi:MAG: type II toxin-antitoxin system HicB family antitoxin [Chromatiaceae bacterium]|nr:type II toxin-antitoxin system HicB family antitoxin [Chromatiaceae bacterium]